MERTMFSEDINMFWSYAKKKNSFKTAKTELKLINE